MSPCLRFDFASWGQLLLWNRPLYLLVCSLFVMVLQHLRTILVLRQSRVCTGSDIGTVGSGCVKVSSCIRVVSRAVSNR